MRARWLIAWSGGIIAAVASIGMRATGERDDSAFVGSRVPSPAANAATTDSGPAKPEFRLAPTPQGRPGSGVVQLVPTQSPFGIAATRDGRLVYDLDIAVSGLPPASALGPYTGYEAWVATPKLDVVRALGPIQNGAALQGEADWNKFTVIISAESPPVGHKWSAAVALIGRSPSSLMQSFASHPLFSTPEPD
jgi:hypothetical protein